MPTFVGFGDVFHAVLFALGVLWCGAILRRVRSDIRELRESDDALNKAVIVGLWIVTMIVAFYIMRFAIAVVIQIVSGARSLM